MNIRYPIYEGVYRILTLNYKGPTANASGKAGFSGKILPERLEIFPENRRLDLAFPYNPGVTFAPSTKMTA